MLPLMVTSTLEFNNSVCLNPRRKAETALQDFLTDFDGAEIQMLHKFKEAVQILGITNPKVISSHGILDSINSIVKLCRQNSELATHISIFFYMF